MIFALAAIALIQALTLFTVLWMSKGNRHSVPVTDYVQLVDGYLDAMRRVVTSKSSSGSRDETDLLP